MFVEMTIDAGGIQSEESPFKRQIFGLADDRVLDKLGRMALAALQPGVFPVEPETSLAMIES